MQTNGVQSRHAGIDWCTYISDNCVDIDIYILAKSSTSKDNVLLNGICFYLKQLALHSVYVLSVHAFHGNQTLGVLLFELKKSVEESSS